MVAPWLRGIAHKDIVAVVSYPASDRQRRMLQLLADKKIQKKYLGNPDDYVWVSLDFRVDPIDDVSDLEKHIQRKLTEQTGITGLKKRTRKKIILYCFGCEELLRTRAIPILIWFTLQCRVDRLRMLLFFEANVFAPSTLELFGSIPAFQPRILYLPLYKEEDVRQFIRYLTESKWYFAITQATVDRIVGECGGVLLLVKEALWYLRDHPGATMEAVFSHTEMQFNLASFWHGFAKNEQQALERVVKHDTLDDRSLQAGLGYLEQVRLVTRERTGWRLTVPLFARYLRESLTQKKQLTLANQKEILLDGVPVGGQFSRAQRRVLTHLLLHPGQVVSRTTIAENLWPSNTHAKYSDWAIDSSISRMRIQLERLGLGSKILETRKGKGFVFQTAL